MFQKLTIKQLAFLRKCKERAARSEFQNIKAITGKPHVTVLDFAKYEHVEPEIVLKMLA